MPNNDWKSPNKIVLGPVATGNSYYSRGDIVDRIWEELEKNCHILIAAPRRVGKTSVMKDILTNEKEGFSLAFESIQNVNSENALYKRLYELMIESLSLKERLKEDFKNWIKSKRIKGIDIKGKIDIEKIEINYIDEIKKVANKILEHDETVILLIDELPEVLFTLYTVGKIEEAKSILKTLRVWRQEDEYKKLKFVFAGSIGIHFIVNRIEGRASDINDLTKVNYEPLTKNDAKNYIDWATEDATIQYSDSLKEIILSKVNYYVPYFINLLIVEIDKQGRKNNNPNITEEEVKKAFDLVVKNTEYFKDWFNRLKDYMPEDDFLFANEVLIHTSHNNFITIQEIYNKAERHNKTVEYMSIIQELENDGYIVENNSKYTFISPFLQSFWLKNNPIYNG